HREETERLVRTVAEALRPQINNDTLLLIGGTPAAETALRKALEPLAGDRMTLDTSLHVNMTPAQLQPVVERTASELSPQRSPACVTLSRMPAAMAAACSTPMRSSAPAATGRWTPSTSARTTSARRKTRRRT